MRDPLRSMPITSERRSLEQLKQHYEIEKELAGRLRQASRQERTRLYSLVYDELYRKVPYLVRGKPTEQQEADLKVQERLLEGFLKDETAFLEIGPGNCTLSFSLARRVAQVFAVDVSEEMTRQQEKVPANFELILSDGTSIALLPESIDVAFSNQFLEHLHPEDVLDHLANVYKVLKPGGVYLCVTPNRLNGPHDISRYFDEIATGFHLKEYTCQELSLLFEQIGFSRLHAYIGGRGIYFPWPVIVVRWLETILAVLPYRLRVSVAWNPILRGILGIRLAGIKR